jgi:hypothetical protein
MGCGPPHFWQGVASATPIQPYGGGRSHPRPLGVVRPPRKAKKKKKTEKNGFGILGVAGPPPRVGWLCVVWPLGGRPPPKAWGGRIRRYGVAGHPDFSLFLFFIFYFYFLLFSKKKTKKQKPKIPKTTPFWAKQRRFG